MVQSQLKIDTEINIFSEYSAIKIFTGLVKMHTLRRANGKSLYVIAYNFYRTSAGAGASARGKGPRGVEKGHSH